MRHASCLATRAFCISMASLEGSAATTEVVPGKAKYQPSEFLKSILGRPVIVKLNSGVDYRGVRYFTQFKL